jgi:hypothetical protein
MGNGIDCHERRLISKLYMDESVKIRLEQRKTRSVKIGSQTRMMFVTDFIQIYSEYLTKKALDGFGISEVGGQVTRCVKYADDPVLLPKEKRCYRVRSAA